MCFWHPKDNTFCNKGARYSVQWLEDKILCRSLHYIQWHKMNKYTNYCQWLLSHPFHSQILCTIIACINDILHHIAGVFLGLSVRFESRVLSTPGSITGGAIVLFIMILRPHAVRTLISWILQHTWIVFASLYSQLTELIYMYVMSYVVKWAMAAKLREDKIPPSRWVSA